MKQIRIALWALAATALVVLAACGKEPPPAAKTDATSVRIRLVTTTSVRDTGLMDALLPVFTKETGVGVDLIAVGTGAAFQQGRDGNADLLLVHDRKGEEDFIAAGDGAARRDLMWNTFEIAGPAEDPAGVKGAKTGAEAFGKIAKASASFVSRGDDSGTHRREKKLWEKAAVDPKWPGYLKTGDGGMGQALLVANEKRAYVLTDRGTRLAYRKRTELTPLVADTADLRNDYAVVLLSEKKHPSLQHGEAKKLADWFTSPETAKRIEAFQVEGEALFHSSAGR